jgi:hypothetical protein
MGRQLQIVREKTQHKKKERVYSAGEALMTDPFDEETGVPSTWGTMVETMVLQRGYDHKGNIQINWKESE